MPLHGMEEIPVLIFLEEELIHRGGTRSNIQEVMPLPEKCEARCPMNGAFTI